MDERRFEFAQDASMPERAEPGVQGSHHAYLSNIYLLIRQRRASDAVFSGKEPGYRYVRSPPNTPTHAAFIEKMKSLEGEKRDYPIPRNGCRDPLLSFHN